MKIPVLIDTDPGLDDALAIMLAVRSGLFDIKALTTVAGNSTIENTTRNARHILKLLRQDDIRVYSGADRPLKRELMQAVVHGESGLEGIDPDGETGLTGDAVDRIIEIVSQNKGITLIALGPLTNIALAIIKDPKAMKNINRLVIMGGAVNVPGNKSRVAEFNMFVDPDAADIVFRFPVEKSLIPLDACNKVEMDLEDFEGLEGTSLYKPVMAMMRPYIDNTFKDDGIRAALMYDPLTVYFLINPSACTIKGCDLMVDTMGATRGRTVCVNKGSERMAAFSVIDSIDAESFKKDFIDILRRKDQAYHS